MYIFRIPVPEPFWLPPLAYSSTTRKLQSKQNKQKLDTSPHVETKYLKNNREDLRLKPMFRREEALVFFGMFDHCLEASKNKITIEFLVLSGTQYVTFFFFIF